MPQTTPQNPTSQLRRPLPPETLNLYATPQGYYLEPNYVYPVIEKPTLQILRPSGTILVNGKREGGE